MSFIKKHRNKGLCKLLFCFVVIKKDMNIDELREIELVIASDRLQFISDRLILLLRICSSIEENNSHFIIEMTRTIELYDKSYQQQVLQWTQRYLENLQRLIVKYNSYLKVFQNSLEKAQLILRSDNKNSIALKNSTVFNILIIKLNQQIEHLKIKEIDNRVNFKKIKEKLSIE